MGCEVVTRAEPHLADPGALDTPGCGAGVDEALAIIREYHGQVGSRPGVEGRRRRGR